MKWLMQFYNERRGILARCDVDAPSPAEAVRLGREAVLVEYPATPRRGRLSLFERAQRVEGENASGWILYRIGRDSARESSGLAAPSTA
jgi:hypothetical protein